MPSAIPLELWKAHIIPCLEKEDKKALRATCRGFLFLISQLWKPRIAFQDLQQLPFFSSQMYPQWPVQLYGLHFNKTYSALDLQILSQLHSLKIMDFSWYKDHLSDQDLTYLPLSITELNLSWCERLTDEGLKYLPSTLTDLNLSGCS